MAVGLSVVFLLLHVTSCIKSQTAVPRLVLLTDSHDDLTSLVVQVAAQASYLQELRNTTPTSTPVLAAIGGHEDNPTRVNVTVEHMLWPTDLRPFSLAKAVSRMVRAGALMLVAVTSQCEQTETLVAASGWGCVPVVVAPPWGCPHIPEGRLLPAGSILLPVLHKVVQTMATEGAAIGENGRILLIVDNTTKPLLSGNVDALLYATHVIEAQALCDVTSDVYADMNQHRDLYRMFVVLVSAISFDIFRVARRMELLSPVQTWVVLTLDVGPSELSDVIQPSDNVIVIDVRRRYQQRGFNPKLRYLVTGRDVVFCVPLVPSGSEKESTPALKDLYDIVRVVSTEVFRHVAMGTLVSFTNCTSPITHSSMATRLRDMTSLRVWTTSQHTSSMSFVGFMNPFSTAKLPFRLVEPFHGFRGRVFTITTLPNKMFQILQKDGTFKGLAFDLLNELAHHLNFTYIIKAPPDGQWGVRRNDSTYTGMIGMVMNREVDFAVGSFTVTAGREEAIDFTFPYWEGSAGMIMRTYSDQGRLLVHLRPFSPPVWACILAVIPLCACVLWTLSALSADMVEGEVTDQRAGDETRSGSTASMSGCTRQRSLRRLNTHTPGLLSLLFMSFGLQCQQSMSWLPRQVSARAALGLWWLVFVILAATYTGNLTAYLTVPKVTVPVDTLEDLADQLQYDVGLVTGQALNDVFENAPEGSVYSRIWSKIAADSDNLVPSFAAGRHQVITSDFIYLDDIKNLVAIQKEEADRGDCSLYIAKQRFYFSGYAFPLQPNSPYLHIFNNAILKVLSSGLTEKWMRRYWPKVTNKCSRGIPVVKSTSVSDVTGLFYLLQMGIGASFLILLLELIVGRSREKSFVGERRL